MSHAESTTTKTAAMTRITFAPTDAAAQALTAFQTTGGPALLELDLVDERIHVTRTEDSATRGDLQKYVRGDDAR
jgi:hypothetical protein